MVTTIDGYVEVDVFVGLDVGKGEHHAVAFDRTGKRLLDKALPNDERRLRAVLDRLTGHGVVLPVVDQPATIGSAFAALHDPESRAYFDRKVAQGKKHNALARRRSDVLYAMLRDGTLYQPHTTEIETRDAA